MKKSGLLPQFDYRSVHELVFAHSLCRDPGTTAGCILGHQQLSLRLDEADSQETLLLSAPHGPDRPVQGH
jgi:hypothetical protein